MKTIGFLSLMLPLALAAAVEPGEVFGLKDYIVQARSAAGTADRGYLTFDSIASPWSSQVRLNDAWSTLRDSHFENGYLYLYVDGNWWYPGVAFYAEPETDKVLFYLEPLKDAGHDQIAALAFTVPASGYYEFGPTPDAQSQWPEETRNFKLIADDAAKGNEAQQTGVRITVDDVKIWPADQEYAVVKTGSNVAVPELENLALTAGQVLRVEARGLTVTRPEFPWAQKISASGQMTFRRPLEPERLAAGFDGREWKTLSKFEVNREPVHTTYMPYDTLEQAKKADRYNPANRRYLNLNGTWKFQLAGKPSERPDGGKIADAAAWDTIEVPGNWQVGENRKFGDKPIFTNWDYAWSGVEKTNFPEPPENFNPVGTYFRTFELPAGWTDQEVFLSFQGVEAAFYVWLNGQPVGYSENSFGVAEFNVGKYLRPGRNTLTVQVFRFADGSYFEDYDFVRVSGIYRDVFLYAVPKVHMRDFKVATKFDADFIDATLRLRVDVANNADAPADRTVEALLFDAGGELAVAGSSSVSPAPGDEAAAEFAVPVKAPRQWSAEDPYLYTLVLNLKDGDEVTEILSKKIGFREVYLDPADRIVKINGRRLYLKGVNRHEFGLDGRVMSEELMRHDLEIMKTHNINAVRTSHYTNNPRWYELCSEYGIYVMDENPLETHAYAGLVPGGRSDCLPVILDRMNTTIERDKNETSVVFWSMGNETGPGSVFRDLFDFCKSKDDRIVHFEADMRYSELFASMYSSPEWVENRANNQEKPVIICEYAHAMGNSEGGLGNWTDVFERNVHAQGGFIWDFNDQGLVEKVPRDTCRAVFDRKHPELKGKLSPDAVVTAGPEPGRQAVSGPVIFAQNYQLDITGRQLTLEVEALPQQGDNDQVLVGKGDSQYALKYYNNGQIEFYIYGDDHTWHPLRYTMPEPERNFFGRWHQFVASYDGRWLKLYLDGQLVASQEETHAIGSNNFPVGVNVNTQYPDRTGSAAVGKVGIYKRAFTPEELKKIGIEDDAVALWLEMNDVREVCDAKSESETFIAYGGDWGEKLHNENGCDDGLLAADHSLQPEMTEVRKQCQDIKFKNFDPVKRTVELHNNFLFTNVDAYDCGWLLKEDDRVIQSGSIAAADLDLPPTGTIGNSKTIVVPFAVPETPAPGAEYWLELRCRLKEDTLWAKTGHVVASEQFKVELHGADFPAIALESLPEFTAVEEEGGIITVTAPDVVVEFDRNRGTLSRYAYRGTELLHAGPRPNFWRAPIDNETYLNSGLMPLITPWYDAAERFRVDDVRLTKAPKQVTITVDGTIPEPTAAKIAIEYVISSNGDVRVAQTFEPQPGETRIPEVGMLLQLPAGFETVEWYGRGPEENYSDRHAGCDVGVYRSTVAEQYFNYSRPQETGNKTDVRYMAVANQAGVGLMAIAEGAPLEASVLHYTPKDLTNVRHLYEVAQRPETVWRLNRKQTGLGTGLGDSIFQEKHRAHTILPGATYRYAYLLRPFDRDMDKMALSKKRLANDFPADR